MSSMISDSIDSMHGSNIFDLKSSLSPLICDDYPIQIRSLTGKHTEIKVHHKMRVSELKVLIEKQDQTPFDQQRLVYNGKQLEDERTLDYYNITQDTVVHIILRIRGGMFHETSARKDFGLVQWATLESIEELEEKIRLLKL
jgi:ubiquitin